jgi:hypothetical protein
MKYFELIQALEIVAKYDPDGYVSGVEHDIIYIGGNPYEMTDEDNSTMQKLGCHVEDEVWASYIYRCNY